VKKRQGTRRAGRGRSGHGKGAKPAVSSKAGAVAGLAMLPPARILKAAFEAREQLIKSDRWVQGFANAIAQDPPLPVRSATDDKGFYIVDFRQGARTTGLMIVNALKGTVDQVAAIRAGGEALLEKFYNYQDIPPLLDGRSELFEESRRVVIKSSEVDVQKILYWVPCDQSITPFLPLYIVVLKNETKDTLYVRIDGEIFTTITDRGKGL
jgi:hypothetical protein